MLLYQKQYIKQTNMKKLFLLLVVLASVFTGCKTQKDPALKAAEKATKEAQETLAFEKSVQAISDHEFVIEADRINFKGGKSVYVSSNTNFISLHDNKAVIQLAFNSPYAGPNGVGGVTVEGLASNVKVSYDSKNNLLFSMNVMGRGVSATVNFTLVKGSNQVSATVNPNFSSNRITFTGYIYPESESKVFKGRSL